jgi:hypothetical protein
VVGLIKQDYDISDDGMLRYEPVVVDELGYLYQVEDYLDNSVMMGGLHWDHCTHFYHPHIDGPVSDAPRIRDLFGSNLSIEAQS